MFPCEEIKHLCRQCSKEFSQKGYVVKHKRAVHEGIKYPCGQCHYQTTKKGNLSKHQRTVHEGIKYIAGNASIEQLQSLILPKTKRQYMKELNTLVDCVENNLLNNQNLGHTKNSS